MRFIEKRDYCQVFDNYVYTNKLKTWNELDGTEIKRIFTKHLFHEQKGLCIYCQQKLNPYNKILSNYAHIEHLKPKHKYPELIFNYENLTVSCNGFDNSQYSTTKEFCGHNKGEKYNENKFLNPTQINNIENYFIYTIEGKIKPANSLQESEKVKAEYMIDLLDLQNSTLERMRAESYYSLIDFNNEETSILLDKNNNLYPSFYSMLKQLFANN